MDTCIGYVCFTTGIQQTIQNNSYASEYIGQKEVWLRRSPVAVKGEGITFPSINRGWSKTAVNA